MQYSAFRRSLISHLKARYFHELGNSIPLGNGYWAQFLENDSYDSFSEIFIQQEYLKFIPKEKISKVLDIGAHYGFFSLWMQATYPKQKIHSVMIEPAESCVRSLTRMTNEPFLEGRFNFFSRAIGKLDSETVCFFNRSHMAGSCFNLTTSDSEQSVQVLKESEVVDLMPPPYDLIKCDIEGSEWEFLHCYQNLIKSSKFLILEWHSWHNGGGGFEQLIDTLKSRKFKILKSSTPMNAVGKKGKVGLILAENSEFNA